MRSSGEILSNDCGALQNVEVDSVGVRQTLTLLSNLSSITKHEHEVLQCQYSRMQEKCDCEVLLLQLQIDWTIIG